jgi:hypothetical protein
MPNLNTSSQPSTPTPSASPVTCVKEKTGAPENAKEAKHKKNLQRLLKRAESFEEKDPSTAIATYNEVIRILRVPPVSEENKITLAECYIHRSNVYVEEEI